MQSRPVSLRIFKMRYEPVLSDALLRKQRLAAVRIDFPQCFLYIVNSEILKAILVAGIAAVLGLNVINSVTNFNALSPDVLPSVFRK